MNSYKQSAVDFLTMIIAGDIDAAYEKYVDMEGKHHNVFTLAGFSALRDGMKEAHIKFPHKQFIIQHTLQDEDLVAVHSRLILEENKPDIAVVHMFRFKDNKIVEMWDVGQPTSADSPNSDGAF
jgi:predicted SnoaL-like aldol condensation-catalyzing enzyme